MSKKQEEQKITVTLADRPALDKRARELAGSMTKAELSDRAEKFYMLVKKGDIIFVDKNGRTRPSPFAKKGCTPPQLYALNKEQLGLVIAVMENAGDSIPVEKELEDSKRDKKLFELMARNFYVGSNEINRILASKAVIVTRSWNGASVNLDLQLKNCKIFKAYYGSIYTDKLNDVYLGLPNSKESYRHTCYADGYLPLELPDKIDDEKASRGFTGFQTVVEAFNMIDGLYDTGQIEIGSTRLVYQNQIKRIEQMMPECQPKEWAGNKVLDDWCQRIRIIAYTRYVSNNRRAKDSEIEKRLKEIFTKLPKAINSVPQLLETVLPHIAGITKPLSQQAYADENGNFINKLLASTSGKWVRVSQIVDKLAVNTTDKTNPLFFSTPAIKSNYDYSRHCDVYTSTASDTLTGKPLNPANLYQSCGEPYVKGYLMALAALGYIEVTMTDQSVTDKPWIDGIEYARLTPLGMFATGNTDTITLKKPDMTDIFTVDPDRLLILATNPRNPYMIWLNKICKSVGINRYQVTEKSFLRYCNNIGDIKEKIEFFKNHICAEPGPAWENLFATMLRKAEEIVFPEEKYSLFAVNPSDKELTAILTSDPDLRKIVIRTENYMILVKLSDIDRFRELMKSHGYLFDGPQRPYSR
ncbi:MAG: hypothetical protein NC336_05815 [Clostridium sp.]|nr:hypothetical protein [Clostridium sp.]